MAMSTRKDAVVRAWAFLWGLFVGSFILGLALIVGIVWGGIDVLWQAIVGSDGLSSSSSPSRWVRGTYEWHADTMAYSFTGAGSFQWLPTPA